MGCTGQREVIISVYFVWKLHTCVSVYMYVLSLLHTKFYFTKGVI